jgi:cytochrome c oxidase subunit II
VRRGTIVQLVLFGAVAGAIATAIAVLIPWLPDWAGKEGQRVGFVFWFTIIICISVFTLVASVSVFALWKFRAAPDDESDGLPIHGHTRLEIVWTVIPIMLVATIAIVSAVVLAKNSNAGSNPLVVKVTGQQFAWFFTYPDGKTYGQLRLPLDRHAELQITSKDVIHSFWVPEFAQKQDAVPGAVNKVVVTPTRVGTYYVICAELCGLGHAIMRSSAIVMEQNAFDSWLKSAAKENGGAAAGGGNAGGGAAVFASAGCSACHTFKPAGATAKVGPDLDNLTEAAQTAGKPLEDFVHESIVDPGAYLAPGFQDIMPHTYKDQLQPNQLDALVQYLVKGNQTS